MNLQELVYCIQNAAEELEQREWFFHLIRMENDKKYKEEIYNS